MRSDIEWSGATFSKCRQYRYSLWRIWDANLPKIVYILLNPSTADEIANDPTVARCTVRAVQRQFGGIWVLNVFAYRSTSPLGLYAHGELGGDPVGADNDAEILRVVKENDHDESIILCGWGKHGKLLDRDRKVLKVLKDHKLHCFGVNGDGTPKHPLYLPYSLEPIVFGDHHGPNRTAKTAGSTGDQKAEVPTESGEGRRT